MDTESMGGIHAYQHKQRLTILSWARLHFFQHDQHAHCGKSCGTGSSSNSVVQHGGHLLYPQSPKSTPTPTPRTSPSAKPSPAPTPTSPPAITALTYNNGQPFVNGTQLVVGTNYTFVAEANAQTFKVEFVKGNDIFTAFPPPPFRYPWTPKGPDRNSVV